jgi:hypothetical protein
MNDHRKQRMKKGHTVFSVNSVFSVATMFLDFPCFLRVSAPLREINH